MSTEEPFAHFLRRTLVLFYYSYLRARGGAFKGVHLLKFGNENPFNFIKNEDLYDCQRAIERYAKRKPLDKTFNSFDRKGQSY